MTADRLNRNCGAREVESGVLECRDEPFDGFALNIGWPDRPHRGLEPHNGRIVHDIGNPLQLERLQEIILQFGILEHREPDLLSYLAQLFEIGITGHAEVEFQRRPVATEIRDLAELSEGNRVDLAILVPEADRAQGEAFDGALRLAAVDVFADAKRIIGQIEDSGHDVADQGLAAERDRKAEHRGAGDEGRDADAKARQYRQASRKDDDGAARDAQNRRKSLEARAADGCLFRLGLLPGWT